MEPKVEPAGNLKGKFAGWLALVGVVSARFSLPWLSTPPEAFPSLRQLASAVHLALFSFSCRLSLTFPVSLYGFPPRYAFR